MHINTTTESRKATIQRQRGDTMIEVLVTIIIIAIGALGAAALQITTLQNLSSSHSASVAAIVAQDFGERMRANPDAALAGNYVHDTKPTSTTDCVGDPCTVTALADYDKEAWWDQITTVLPSGSGEVKALTAGGNIFELTVRWDEDRSGSTGVNCSGKDVDLECFRLNITI